jgi:hypothetical protein
MTRPLGVDHRADIYSLGVVLYELLTNDLPMGRFPLPSERVQVDVRLDDVVLRALEREPDLRYQQVAQFKDDVERVARSADAAEGERSAPRTAVAAARAQERSTAEDSDPVEFWISRLPLPRILFGVLMLVLAVVWAVLVASFARGPQITWIAVAYPLTVLALHASRPHREGAAAADRMLFGLSALVGGGILFGLSEAGGLQGLHVVVEVLAIVLLLLLHVPLDAFVRHGSVRHAVAAVALMVIALVLHGSIYADRGAGGRTAYYFATGYSALLATASCVAVLPGLAIDGFPRRSYHALVRALCIALPTAVLYFHQMIF